MDFFLIVVSHSSTHFKHKKAHFLHSVHKQQLMSIKRQTQYKRNASCLLNCSKIFTHKGADP